MKKLEREAELERIQAEEEEEERLQKEAEANEDTAEEAVRPPTRKRAKTAPVEARDEESEEEDDDAPVIRKGAKAGQNA